MSAVHTNASGILVHLSNSHVDNVLVKIAPDLNQPLFQFINAVDVCMVNTFLNGRPYLIVNWLFGDQKSKVWLISTHQFDSFISDLQVHYPAETRLNDINLMSSRKKMNDY